jgi:hypothetical protein
LVHRSLFRITIRDLLWLTLLACVATAWWAHQHVLQAKIDEFGNQAAKVEAVVSSYRRAMTQMGLDFDEESGVVYFPPGDEFSK